MRIVRTLGTATALALTLASAAAAQPSDVWSLNHNSSPASTVRFWTQSGAGVRAQYVTLADILLGTVVSTDDRLNLKVVVGDPLTGATSLGGADDTATIQAALNYAAGLARQTEVVMPGGTYKACGVKMRSRVDFGGQGRATKIQSTAGCTTGVIILNTSSTERFRLHDLWVDCNGASTSGFVINNDGGTFTGADPEITLEDLDATNCALDGFSLTSRGLQGHRLRSRANTRDGFALLAGSTVSMSDGVFTNLSADASGRDGLHIESVENSVTGMKIGESGRYGLYLTSGGNWNTLSTIAIDNTGYPSFASGTPVRIETIDNQVDGILISRGVGAAIVLTSTSARNSVRATVLPVAGGGTLTYGALLTSGSTGNDVRLTANLSGTPAMTGLFDPASDLTANFATGNGADVNMTSITRNTTGSAAKWTTARTLAGNSVDGSANVAFSNKLIVQGTSDAGLSAAQFLGSLATGIVKNTTTTGVLSIAVAGDFPSTLRGWTYTSPNVSLATGTDKVGIGTASPDVSLAVWLNSATPPAGPSGTITHLGSADGANTIALLDAGGAAQGALYFRRADTSIASPSAIQAGDAIGLIGALGYGATAYSAASRAAIQFVADQTWTDSAQGTNAQIQTTLDGTMTKSTKLTISTSGHLLTTGAAPSVACTGTGTSPTAPSIASGGTDANFTIIMPTGTGAPGSTGTCTVTFSTAYLTNKPQVICTLQDGASAWGNEAVLRVSTSSLSAPVIAWTNEASGALTGLTVSTSYQIACITMGNI